MILSFRELLAMWNENVADYDWYMFENGDIIFFKEEV